MRKSVPSFALSAPLALVLLCACGGAPATADEKPLEPGEELYVAHFDGAEGYVDRDGKVVIPARYELASTFSEGLAKVSVTSGKKHTGFIDPAGNWVIQPTLRSAKSFSDGRAAATDSKTRGAGYIDRTGKWVIPPKFQRAMPFHEGRAVVELARDKGAVIDVDGNIVFHFPPGGDVRDPPEFSEGLMGIELKSSVRYVDRDGKTVFEGPWKFGRSFREGLAAVRDENGWSFVDRTGKVVFDGFEFAWGFCDGLAPVKRVGDEKSGYIDRTGQWVIPPILDDTGCFSEGLAAIRVDGKVGYIDRTGKWVHEPQWADPYSSAASFRRGRAMVGVKTPDGKLLRGYIDKAGTMVVKPGR